MSCLQVLIIIHHTPRVIDRALHVRILQWCIKCKRAIGVRVFTRVTQPKCTSYLLLITSESVLTGNCECVIRAFLSRHCARISVFSIFSGSFIVCCERNSSSLRDAKVLGSLGCFDWCCLGMFCAPCSNCQVGRENTVRDVWPGGACCNNKPFNMS